MPVDQGWGCAIDAVLIRPWRQPANWGGGSIDGSSGTVVNIKFLALAGVDHDTKLFALNMCSLVSVSVGKLSLCQRRSVIQVCRQAVGWALKVASFQRWRVACHSACRQLEAMQLQLLVCGPLWAACRCRLVREAPLLVCGPWVVPVRVGVQTRCWWGDDLRWPHLPFLLALEVGMATEKGNKAGGRER